MKQPPPCRLHVTLARGAPVAAVFRRGPSRLWHVARWDLRAQTVTHGAWFHGKLYPRRCSLSADGSRLSYFALTGRRGPWDTYHAVSKLPWLRALIAWPTMGTWTSPLVFSAAGSLPPTKPIEGTCPPDVRFVRAPPHFYVTGREDGWTDDLHAASTHAAALPPRTVRYPQIAAYRSDGPKASLVVVQRGADFRTKTAPLGGWIEGAVVDYVLEQRKRHPLHLADVAWANWDGQGRLLVATHDGVLQIRRVLGRGGTEVCWSHDANADRYADGLGAPAWAKRW